MLPFACIIREEPGNSSKKIKKAKSISYKKREIKRSRNMAASVKLKASRNIFSLLFHGTKFEVVFVVLLLLFLEREQKKSSKQIFERKYLSPIIKKKMKTFRLENYSTKSLFRSLTDNPCPATFYSRTKLFCLDWFHFISQLQWTQKFSQEVFYLEIYVQLKIF